MENEGLRQGARDLRAGGGTDDVDLVGIDPDRDPTRRTFRRVPDCGVIEQRPNRSTAGPKNPGSAERHGLDGWPGAAPKGDGKAKESQHLGWTAPRSDKTTRQDLEYPVSRSTLMWGPPDGGDLYRVAGGFYSSTVIGRNIPAS